MKKPAITPKQYRHAIIGGCVLFLLVTAGVTAWLMVSADNTVQNREAMTPSVTVKLDDGKSEVPKSWAKEKDLPEVMPPAQELPAVKPEVEAPKEEVKEEIKEEPKPEAKAKAKPEPEAEAEAKPEVNPEEKKTEEPVPAVTEDAVKVSTPEPVPAQPAWQRYARPFENVAGHARIGVIILDMGLASATTQSAIQDLPGEVTLAFSSLAGNLESDMAKARAAGHEILLSIPMEPDNYPMNDAGPNSLLTALPNDENIKRLQYALARSDGYVGIIPTMGERFITREDKMAPIMQVLHGVGLLAVDGSLLEMTAIPSLSRLGKMPFARVDTILDAAARSTIDIALTDLEAQAIEKGQVIVAVKPYPVVFEKLAAWAQTLAQKNIVLAPITAVAAVSAPVITTPTKPVEGVTEEPQPQEEPVQ